MISVAVIGTPAPQGSKRHVGHGRLVEMSKALKPWRTAVEAAARASMHEWGDTTLTGPVEVDVTFALARPSSVTRPRPSVRPDLDKLVRSTLDALVTAGAIADDSLVVELRARKVYAPTMTQTEPGALIRIYPKGAP